MFDSVCRLSLFRFSARANLVPSRFMLHFCLSLGTITPRPIMSITLTSVLAARVTSAWDDTRDQNLADYIVYYGYANGHYEGSVGVGMQTTPTFLDLEEAQAYYFALASYDANDEESELSSEIIFAGLREDPGEERDEVTVRRWMRPIGPMQTMTQLTTLGVKPRIGNTSTPMTLMSTKS
jgi:hypothetical protein